MSKKDEALRLALEALELSSVTVDSFGVQQKTQEAITALREALAEQPAQRKPLTDEQIDAVWDAVPQTQFWWRSYARAIEAKSREKNT
jgi:hypothetical protein